MYATIPRTLPIRGRHRPAKSYAVVMVETAIVPKGRCVYNDGNIAELRNTDEAKLPPLSVV